MTRELGKWPRLVIVGDPVTPEQAEVILVRTQVHGLLGWDQRWKCSAAKVMGFPDDCPKGFYSRDPEVINAHFLDEDEARERLGMLTLDILWNDRIVGPQGHAQGWCTWEGAIGDTRWNVGSKWPEIDDITHEWRLIAETFPYLKLSCQVVADEGVDGYNRVAAQWHVADGIARQVEIGPLLAPLEEVDWQYEADPVVHGITLEGLNQAVRRTIESLNPRSNPLFSA